MFVIKFENGVAYSSSNIIGKFENIEKIYETNADNVRLEDNQLISNVDNLPVLFYDRTNDYIDLCEYNTMPTVLKGELFEITLPAGNYIIQKDSTIVWQKKLLETTSIKIKFNYSGKYLLYETEKPCNASLIIVVEPLVEVVEI